MCVRTHTCVFARNSVCFCIHYKTKEALRGRDLGAVWMSVLMYVGILYSVCEGECVRVCVRLQGGGKHHCGRQADGDGNE